MVYLALGSNLGDRLGNLQKARELLRPLASGDLASAPVYESDPLDCPPDSPPFLNTVISFESEASPEEMLATSQSIEAKMGRESEKTRLRNAPRPIDIDLLLIANTVLNSPALTIPHPRLHERLFVLHPLRELAPALVPPTHANPVSILLELCSSGELPPQVHRAKW